jgi:hypothetical protein
LKKKKKKRALFFLSVVTDKEIETEGSSFLMGPLLHFLIFFFASSGSGNAATSHLPRLSFRLSCFGHCYFPLEPSVVSCTDYSIAILSASTSSQVFSPSLHSRPLHPFSVVLLVMWSFFFVLEKFWHGPHQAAWLGVLLLCRRRFSSSSAFLGYEEEEEAAAPYLLV